MDAPEEEEREVDGEELSRDDLVALYGASDEDVEAAYTAISDHQDYNFFKLPPNPGGLEDQPDEWVESVRIVERARSSAEAMRRTKEDYEHAMSGRSAEEGLTEDQQQAKDRYDELRARYDEMLTEMRAGLEV